MTFALDPMELMVGNGNHRNCRQARDLVERFDNTTDAALQDAFRKLSARRSLVMTLEDLPRSRWLRARGAIRRGCAESERV